MTDTTLLSNTHLTARISDLGAELQALAPVGGPDLLWHGDPAHWGGRSPVLFPIVGRAEEDRIAVNGREGRMAQHGFARRSRFTRVAADADFCRHALTASDDSRAAYPFDFRLELTHALDGASLSVTAEVTNLDAVPLPFGLGFHPAFRWPLPGAEGRPHHIRLDNGAEPALARLQGGLMNDARLPSPFRAGAWAVDPAMFDDDAMIFPEGAGDGLRYTAPGAPGLRFAFSGLPNLALWSKPGAPFLCIEPWHGMAAAAGAGPEIAARPWSISLPPGESRSFGWRVTVEA